MEDASWGLVLPCPCPGSIPCLCASALWETSGLQGQSSIRVARKAERIEVVPPHVQVPDAAGAPSGGVPCQEESQVRAAAGTIAGGTTREGTSGDDRRGTIGEGRS
eukprot:354436-Chlamydomonas_euryale.AAC.2